MSLQRHVQEMEATINNECAGAVPPNPELVASVELVETATLIAWSHRGIADENGTSRNAAERRIGGRLLLQRRMDRLLRDLDAAGIASVRQAMAQVLGQSRAGCIIDDSLARIRATPQEVFRGL
jgi:hypothetical protein